MACKFPYSFGWIPDLPDIRDYTEENDKIKMLTTNLRTANSDSSINLTKWCSPVENQGDIGSCTAHAVAGVVEYFENKAFGKYIDSSRLFLYKTTRNLLKSPGDTGAYLKTALGALVLFGMPPEDFWPYDTSRFDIEPISFCYAFANNYKCINYFRHDPAGISPQAVLDSVKKYLMSGIPSVFGFTVYESIKFATSTGCIPFPGGNERILGGHAIAAFGFDDNKIIGGAKPTKGALLIRNSWGEEWGETGYGWLPYEYVLKGLALDFWSVLKQEWVDAEQFLNTVEG